LDDANHDCDDQETMNDGANSESTPVGYILNLTSVIANYQVRLGYIIRMCRKCASVFHASVRCDAECPVAYMGVRNFLTPLLGFHQLWQA
jgi:hypothetical protein